MPGIVPVRVGIGGKHTFERPADLFLSCKLFTVGVGSRGSLKHAVACHVRHDRVKVVRVERVWRRTEGKLQLPAGLIES